MTRLNRASKQLARELDRSERQAERQGRPDAPPGAAAQFRARVAALTECHRVAYAPRDWGAVAARGETARPVRANIHELAARRALVAYKPNLMDRMFGLEQEKRRELAMRVAQEASKDEAAWRAACKIASEHNAEVQFAAKLMKLDLPTLHKALAEQGGLEEIKSAMDGIDLAVPSRGRLLVTVAGLEMEDMPDERAEHLESGKAVFKPLPRAARHMLHRANICSVALRVGLEVLTVAPIPTVDVVVECDLPDPSTGETSRWPVLHLRAAHRAFLETPPGRLDPVEVASALGARMDWSPGEGFRAIQPETAAQTSPA